MGYWEYPAGPLRPVIRFPKLLSEWSHGTQYEDGRLWVTQLAGIPAGLNIPPGTESHPTWCAAQQWAAVTERRRERCAKEKLAPTYRAVEGSDQSYHTQYSECLHEYSH
jgi:hypothetical protein